MKEVTLKNSNFEAEVLKSEGRVLVDFWASWCGPCQMLAPVISEIAEENDDLKVGKVNIDEEMELAEKFGIASIPTLLLFENGQPVKQHVGFAPKAQIESMWK